MRDNAYIAMIELVDFNNLYNSKQVKAPTKEQVVNLEESPEF